VGAVPPDGDGQVSFAHGIERTQASVEVHATIESMNGARLVHDTLERWDWKVAVADEGDGSASSAVPTSPPSFTV
jgi:hypothetical protein